MEFWSELLSAIASLAVICSAVFVGQQVRIMRKENSKKHQKQEFQSSFALSEYYAREIIPRIEALISMFRKIEYEEILSKSKNHNIDFFDINEYRKIYSKEDHEKISEIFDKPIKIGVEDGLQLLAWYQREDHHDSFLKYINYCSILKSNGAIEEDLQKEYAEYIGLRLNGLVVDTANKLEYFSMHFSTNFADDDVVFQSLHQTFLNIVELLYYNAALRNFKYSQKFYTHTFTLYKLWKTRLTTSEQEDENEMNKMRSKHSIPKIKKR